MSRYPQKKNIVKEFIEEYLKRLYYQQLYYGKIDKDDKDRISTKINLVQAVYDLNENKIIESKKDSKVDDQTDIPEDPDAISISHGTINNAINELLKDSIIVKKSGQYQYNPTESELHSAFPILKVASAIKITPLEIDSVAFYRTGTQYAALITTYINSQFSNDDIYAVNLGDVIMCMDIHIPNKKISVTKRFPLDSRISEVLKPFDLDYPKHFDDKDGISQDELDSIHERAVIKTMEQEHQRDTSFGGKIEDPPRRNIRKQKTQD